MTKSLWQPPRLRTVGETEEERRATWLELFYDLIFVAAVSQVAHYLSKHVSVSGFFECVLLFVPVWWSWVGATFYATRFDTDDLGHRLLTLLQMVAISVLAVNVHHGLEESSAGFALSYVTIRGILIVQYLLAGYHIKVARPLIKWYVRGFGIGAGLWLVSVFVPAPWRFALWVLGLLADFITPLTAGKLVAQIPPSFTHVPERLGLFTIIVLGEAVIAVVKGVAQLEWGALSAIEAVLGMVIAFSLWWVYFDTVDGSPLRAMGVGRMDIGLTWLYAHLPLAIGIAATGVGVEHVISSDVAQPLPAAERALICVAVALCLVSLALIHLITCSLGPARRRKILSAYRIASAAFVLVLAVAGGSLSPVVLIALVAVACALQVVLDLLGSSQAGAEAKAETISD